MILADNEKPTGARRSTSCCRCSAATSTACSRRCTATPVTIRTIDPPLHEFLPKREDLMVDIAQARGDRQDGPASSTRRSGCCARVEQLHEFNPMLGHRGVRLGITYPEITEMQARAIIEAACQLNEGRREGRARDHDSARRRTSRSCAIRRPIVDRVADEVMKEQGVKVQVPGRHDDRGAARRDDGRRDRRARREFFSFGTNDLTQLTFGFSRDDVGKFLRRLSGAEDPRAGSVRVARHRGRRRSSCAIGVEQGPADQAGPEARRLRRARRRPVVDPLLRQGRARLRERSPFRVPVARLAAAQAALTRRKGRTV